MREPLDRVDVGPVVHASGEDYVSVLTSEWRLEPMRG